MTILYIQPKERSFKKDNVMTNVYDSKLCLVSPNDHSLLGYHVMAMYFNIVFW